MNRFLVSWTLVYLLAAQSHLAGDPAATPPPADPGLANQPLVITTDFFSGFGWNRRELELREPAISFWLESSLKRVFPTSLPGNGQTLDQLTPRNARFSFQACLRNDRSWPMEVECSVSGAEDFSVQIRRVGFVPQWNFTADTPESELDGLGHIPGLVPDPLFPESKATVGPFAAQSFWISVQVPAEAKPGVRTLTVRFTSPDSEASRRLTCELEICPLVVRAPQELPRNALVECGRHL